MLPRCGGIHRSAGTVESVYLARIVANGRGREPMLPEVLGRWQHLRIGLAEAGLDGVTRRIHLRRVQGLNASSASRCQTVVPEVWATRPCLMAHAWIAEDDEALDRSRPSLAGHNSQVIDVTATTASRVSGSGPEYVANRDE